MEAESSSEAAAAAGTAASAAAADPEAQYELTDIECFDEHVEPASSDSWNVNFSEEHQRWFWCAVLTGCVHHFVGPLSLPGRQCSHERSHKVLTRLATPLVVC